MTLRKAWEEFENEIVPKTTSAADRAILRDAFYAGAANLLRLLKSPAALDALAIETASYVADKAGLFQ